MNVEHLHTVISTVGNKQQGEIIWPSRLLQHEAGRQMQLTQSGPPPPPASNTADRSPAGSVEHLDSMVITVCDYQLLAFSCERGGQQCQATRARQRPTAEPYFPICLTTVFVWTCTTRIRSLQLSATYSNLESGSIECSKASPSGNLNWPATSPWASFRPTSFPPLVLKNSLSYRLEFPA